MKKLLLILMLLASITTMSAQDEMEQTLPPTVLAESSSNMQNIYISDDHYDQFYFDYYYVTVEPAGDAETTIYYRYARENEEPSQWMEYDGVGLSFTYYGEYVFEAYAQEAGKLPSEVVSTQFYVIDEYAGSHFRVDGLYYTSHDYETLVVTKDFEYDDVLYSGDIVIPETVEIEGNTYTVVGIDYQTFDSPDVRSVVMPNTLTFIRNQAFMGSGISELFIPASVDYIEEEVFNSCSNLVSISVDPNNTVYDSRNDCNAIIGTRGNVLLYGCRNTVIPASVTSIGDLSFSGCTGLTSIDIPNTVTSIGFAAFAGCTGLTGIELPGSLTSISSRLFYNCSSLTSVSIPTSVTRIGSSAFGGCRSLESVELPDAITKIESGTFGGCWALSSIEIPSSVTSISNDAFYGCRSLTDLVIPDAVTSVGYVAFSECTSLKTVTLGKSVITLNSSFKGCTAMTSMKVLATTPPSASWIFSYNGNEDYLYDQVALFVPNESLEAYQSHRTWGKFTHTAPFIGVGPGDVDGDGVIGITDVTNMIDLILAGDAPAYCDVDGDGVASISDLTILIDMILSGNI